MLERLFTSKTRVKILTLFILNPNRELHIREVARLIQENTNAVRRELNNLEQTGLLKSNKKGNLKQYTLKKLQSIYKCFYFTGIPGNYVRNIYIVNIKNISLYVYNFTVSSSTIYTIAGCIT